MSKNVVMDDTYLLWDRHPRFPPVAPRFFLMEALNFVVHIVPHKVENMHFSAPPTVYRAIAALIKHHFFWGEIRVFQQMYPNGFRVIQLTQESYSMISTATSG